MYKVRYGAFETNSSSVHAIIVAENRPEYISGETIFFNIGSFGWSMDVLDSIDERASYFYTAACELFERDIADELCDKLEPLGIECIFPNPPTFEE